MRCLFILSTIYFVLISCSEENTNANQIPISSTNDEAISFFYKAKIHEQNFEFKEAKEDFQSAIELDPNFILAHINLFREKTSNTDWIDLSDKDIDLIETMIPNGTDYEKLLFEMYKIPFRRNDSSLFNSRLKIGQKLVNSYPDISDPLIILAHQIPNYASNKDWRILRKESLKKAIEIDPNNIVAHEELLSTNYGGTPNSIRFRSDLDFYESFDKDARELISKFPNSPRILRRVANIYRNSYDYSDTTRYEKSLEIFEKLLSILINTESSFIKDVLKFKADLLINIDRREECYEAMRLAVDLSKSLNQKIDAIFALILSYISGGDYLIAIEDLDKFNKTLDEGLYDLNGEEVSQDTWLKCKVSLNLYKALIYAHANQAERARMSLKEYKDYVQRTIQFNQIKTNEDLRKYYSKNDLNSVRVRWKTIDPRSVLFNEVWVSVLIGDDKKTKDLINKLPENSMWIGIYTVIKGDFTKGIEILSNNNSFYSQYFQAQALIGQGKIEEARDILDNLRYIPYQNFDTSWTKNRAARLYQTL